MKNIISYVKKYGDKSFDELEFNILDSAIFSAISYMDFGEIFSNKMVLNDALRNFLLYKDKSNYTKYVIFQKSIIELANVLLDKKRYKDIVLKDYVYKIDNNEQFGAITFLFNNIKYISFEGTDNRLVGWEEDFSYSYMELTPADRDAIEYLNREINILDKSTIYVGGHSKGGRLAVVSSMNISKIKSRKIVNIYSFDGPGLLEKSISSSKYKMIENRIIYIIPSYCIVGLLLRHNNNYKVARTNRIDINAHSLFNWEIVDIDFKYTELSRISKSLDESLSLWLDEHNNDERKLINKSVFNIFRDMGLETIDELFKIRNILSIIKNSRSFDDDTVKVLKHFFDFNIKSIVKF